jgi:hypothetical protein
LDQKAMRVIVRLDIQVPDRALRDQPAQYRTAGAYQFLGGVTDESIGILVNV